MDLTNPLQRYWHCCVKIAGQKVDAIINDISFAELERQVVTPWNSGQAFSVAGTVVRSSETVSEIRIVWTERPLQFHAEQQLIKTRKWHRRSGYESTYASFLQGRRPYL